MIKRLRAFFRAWERIDVSFIISVMHELGYRERQVRFFYLRRRK